MGLFFHSVSPPSSSGSSSSFLSLGAERREGKVGSISVWLKASGCEEASLILAWFSLFLCEASGPYWSGTLLMKDKVVFLSEAQFSWSPLMQGPTQREGGNVSIQSGLWPPTSSWWRLSLLVMATIWMANSWPSSFHAPLGGTIGGAGDFLCVLHPSADGNWDGGSCSPSFQALYSPFSWTASIGLLQIFLYQK